MNINRFKSLLYYLFVYPYYKIIIKHIGFKSKIISPLKIDNPSNIYIGDNVIIQYKTWLAAIPLTGAKECKLIIQDGSRIGNFNHIYATSEIIIGKNVLIADKVYITDNSHSYADVNVVINNQPIKQLQKVRIGDGAWIGESACIIGSNVGKQSVIGANAVVTKNIPDYCIAVGAPAKIIKRYSPDRKQWLKTNPDGEFIE